jgi:hypothetical protein
MRESKRMEMNINEMDQVAGGLIIYCGFFSYYKIVNDQTGDQMGTAFFKICAIDAADMLNVSTETIDEDEYKERFNK